MTVRYLVKLDSMVISMRTKCEIINYSSINKPYTFPNHPDVSPILLYLIIEPFLKGQKSNATPTPILIVHEYCGFRIYKMR